MQLSGPTVIVSGVGTGLGKEIGAAIVEGGGHAVLGARTADTLQQVAGELDPSGERVDWQRTDITSADDCDALVAFAVKRFGRLDGVVHCAALDNTFGGIEDADFDVWRKVGEITANMSIKQIPTSRDIADSVAFFLSDESRRVTGQQLLVNAGEYLR